MKKRHSQNLACAFSSYQYSLQMVHFVLHDFCRKTGEPLFLLMEIFIFIADCDIVIAPAEAAAKEAEASFLCFVTGKGVQDDFGLYMRRRWSSSLTAMMAFVLPIMLAAMPTQVSLWAVRVSRRSRPSEASFRLAFSAFRWRKRISLTIGRIMKMLLLY